ncbi:MAG TPA: helix-turn-helix transcriptional regulator [Methanocorpusculum sp.]|nr:helix-turn-helix transcriptional regulator [Methanocorpusculum sp.]
MELHKKLSKARKEKGMSQLEVAEAMQVSRQAVSRWEVGATAPSIENLSSLSKLYGVSLDYLLNDEEDELTPKDDEEYKGETVTSKNDEESTVENSDRKIKADIRKKLLISATILILIAVCVIATVFLQKWGGVSIDTLTTEQSIVEDNTDEFNFIT